MSFEKWLDTLIDEKGVDPEATFEIETPDTWHLIPYGCVLEALKATNPAEQKAIKATMVKIDFVNGDIKHYLRHLAQALV